MTIEARRTFTRQQLGIPIPFAELIGCLFSFRTENETIRGIITGTSERDEECRLFVSIPSFFPRDDGDDHPLLFLAFKKFNQDSTPEWFAVSGRPHPEGFTQMARGSFRYEGLVNTANNR